MIDHGKIWYLDPGSTEIVSSLRLIIDSLRTLMIDASVTEDYRKGFMAALLAIEDLSRVPTQTEIQERDDRKRDSNKAVLESFGKNFAKG